jgi:hypothetical protein
MAAAGQLLQDFTERSVLPKLEERIARLNLSITGAQQLLAHMFAVLRVSNHLRVERQLDFEEGQHRQQAGSKASMPSPSTNSKGVCVHAFACL